MPQEKEVKVKFEFIKKPSKRLADEPKREQKKESITSVKNEKKKIPIHIQQKYMSDFHHKVECNAFSSKTDPSVAKRNSSSLESNAIVNSPSYFSNVFQKGDVLQNKKCVKESTSRFASESLQNDSNQIDPCSNYVEEVVVRTDEVVTAQPKKTSNPNFQHTCHECSKTFTNKSLFEIHLATHRDLKPYVCEACCQCYMTIVDFNAHSCKISKTSPYPKPNLISLVANNATSASLRRELKTKNKTSPNLLVKNANKSSKTSPKPNLSISLVANNKTSASPKVQLKTTYKVPPNLLVRNANNCFTCNVCDKEFKNKCYFERHFFSHSKAKPYVCKVCSKGFSQSGNLNVHLQIHATNNGYPCYICDKQFAQLNLLKAHLNVHSGPRPHKCDVCKKTFARLCFLNRHLLTHSGSRPHVCKVCGKGFTQVGNLNVHMLKHENHNLVCGVCNRTFKYKKHFDQHQEYHEKEKEYFARCELEKAAAVAHDSSDCLS